MRLEDIGFYTLSDYRARNSSEFSPLVRCEMVLTDRCNFKCPYCRGSSNHSCGTMDIEVAMKTLDMWLSEGLRNVRFSGGEPTLYKGIERLVDRARSYGVERCAISTNGSARLEKYKQLYDAGVNDFSVSLDGGCCSVGETMTGGIRGSFEKTVENIKQLSEITYCTVGMVFTGQNIDNCVDAVKFASGLGVSDIRIIPAAQYKNAMKELCFLPEDILKKHPILNYRVQNAKKDMPVRGISDDNYSQCWLALDDVAVAQNWHFPCIIYMREGGLPAGKMDETFRSSRAEWTKKHRPWKDEICKKNCLDVCVEYNRRAHAARTGWY